MYSSKEYDFNEHYIFIQILIKQDNVKIMHSKKHDKYVAHHYLAFLYNSKISYKTNFIYKM